MAKLTRVTGKVFGSAAQAQSGGIGQFGSAATGTPNPTTDVATIQALQAYLDGWGSAVITSRNFPPIEEVTGVLKTISYQACYTLQEGIPEYDINTEYSNTSVVKSINNGITTLYVSLANGNIGNPLTDTTKWKSYVLDQIQRNIGEIVTSTIPLTDAGLHLLDGSLLSGAGGYGGFVAYIANLYTADPTANYFCTEAQWQTAVSTYGVCGKFVYDSVNNTVRLPKYNSKIYTGGGTAPVIGNGLTLGITNGTFNQGLIQNGTSGGVNVLMSSDEVYGKPVGTSWSTLGNYDPTHSFGVSTDPTKSGLVANLSNITTSLDGYYYIVIATSAKTDIQVDIDQIEADLAGKADKDLTNCVAGAFESIVSLAQSSGKDTITSWGMPDYSAGINCPVGTDFTCPTSGWVLMSQYCWNSGAHYIKINSLSFVFTQSDGNYLDLNAIMIPVSAGDVINNYGANGTNYFIFYPVKGAN